MLPRNFNINPKFNAGSLSSGVAIISTFCQKMNMIFSTAITRLKACSTIMNSILPALLLSLAAGIAARAADSTQFFYDPVPSTLTGILSKVDYGKDAAPADQGHSAWILRLDRTITVNPKDGSELDVLARDVSEVQLMADDGLVNHAALEKGSVTFYGTLFHGANTHHLRPVLMRVSAYEAVAPPVREIRPSPDGKFFVAWLDHDAGPPIGVIRSIMLRYTTDQESLFSFVSSPRYTDAVWNPSSTRCVIADAPDNGGPRTWLVSKPPEGKDDWKARKIDPFAVLEKAYYHADPKNNLFRPWFSKIEWLSDTRVQFRGGCNSGTYLLTMDTTTPDKAPKAQKLSAEPREK